MTGTQGARDVLNGPRWRVSHECSTGTSGRMAPLRDPGRSRLMGVSEQALVCPPGRFAFPNPRARQDPAWVMRTLTDDVGAGHGTKLRTEGGHGLYALCRQEFAHRAVTLANKQNAHLVQTLALHQVLGYAYHGTAGRCSWGSMGMPGCAHESKCPKLQRLANLALGRTPTHVGCHVLGWFGCGGGHGS